VPVLAPVAIFRAATTAGGRATMLTLLIVLGALLVAIGYALPDQDPSATSKPDTGPDQEHRDLMEHIARSMF
jgi:hypothetical protein